MSARRCGALGPVLSDMGTTTAAGAISAGGRIRSTSYTAADRFS